jgi:hypothetical protein
VVLEHHNSVMTVVQEVRLTPLAVAVALVPLAVTLVPMSAATVEMEKQTHTTTRLPITARVDRATVLQLLVRLVRVV